MAYRALLKPAAEATQLLSNTVLHPTYFPYPLTLCLHALRISHVYSSKVKAAGHKLPPAQHLAGFLVMAWGGALWVNTLLCLPPPQLYSTTPWIIYCSIHVLANAIITYTPLSWPSPILMDSIFAPIDAICRSGAIIGAVSAVAAHPNPAVANSLLAQIIMGAVSSVGGGAAAGFFGVWDKEWSLKTPAFLKGGIIPTMDVWAGSLAAVLYGIATFSNPAYSDINTYLVGKPAPFMTALGARSLVVVFLTAMYTVRVVSTHFVPKGNLQLKNAHSATAATPSSKRAIKPMPVGREKKSQ